jgi:xylose isomerase
MPDELVYDATVWTFTRTGENQTRTIFNVLVDKASKLGYNDHVLQPDPKDATKHYPLSRAVPFLRMTVTAYLILW